MRLDEALDLVKKICAGFNGTLKDHQMIQEALGIIIKQCYPQPAQKEDTTDKKKE